MTNNLANISVFESLQTEQHDRTGVNQMSVFNTQKDVDDIKKANDDYAKVLDKAIAAKEKYKQVLKDINKRRKEQADAINEAKDVITKKEFAKEHDTIRDGKSRILEKQKQIDIPNE
jgi:hypothetical protein